MNSFNIYLYGVPLGTVEVSVIPGEVHIGWPAAVRQQLTRVRLFEDATRALLNLARHPETYFTTFAAYGEIIRR